MPKHTSRKKRRQAAVTRRKQQMEEQLDQLEAFRKFQEELIPEVADMVMSGKSHEQILKHFQPYAAARIVSIILADADNAKGLAASKELIDRTSGKAVERKKLQHEMAGLDDNALDALIMSAEESEETPIESESESDKKVQ